MNKKMDFRGKNKRWDLTYPLAVAKWHSAKATLPREKKKEKVLDLKIMSQLLTTAEYSSDWLLAAAYVTGLVLSPLHSAPHTLQISTRFLFCCFYTVHFCYEMCSPVLYNNMHIE